MAKKTNVLVLAQEFVAFPDNEAHLQKIAADYKNLVVTEEVFEEGKKARQILRKERYDVQNIQKSNNAILNNLKSQNADIAAKLINIVVPVEGEIDLQIKVIESKRAEVKAEKERQKAEQMQEWNNKAQSILDYSGDLINALTTESVKDTIAIVNAIDLSEDEFGAYLLIAQQNAAKVLEQAETVLERIAQAEKEAQERRVEQEQEQERIKAETLVTARVDYKAYFHSIPNVEHTAQQLDKLVEDDKQTKLKRLEELEAKERAEVAEQKKQAAYRDNLLETYFDYSCKHGDKLSNDDLVELINGLQGEAAKRIDEAPKEPCVSHAIPDTKEVKDWINSFVDTAPQTDDEELNNVIDKAIEYVNELLGSI